MQWIPCSEKLPEEACPVIGSYKSLKGQIPMVVIRSYCAEEDFSFYTVEFPLATYSVHERNITHWMPLPPMPEEEAE